MESSLIFYPIAFLIGTILYFFLRKKIIDKKLLKVIATVLIFCILYFSLCFSLINTSGLEVFSFSINRYLHYVQIAPLIIIITFYSLYWLKHFWGKEEKSTEKQKSKDSEIIFIGFVVAIALINLFLPPIQELWLKLVVMLGFGTFVGLTVGLFLWRSKKRKEFND